MSHAECMINKLLFLLSFDTKPTSLSKLDQPMRVGCEGVSVFPCTVYSVVLLCVK